MKKILLFFLASLTLVGCTWDDPSTTLIEALKREKQEQRVQPGIEFYSEFDAAPVVPGESDETPIYFNSNMGWKAEATSSWFSISPKEGEPGNGSVVIKAEANEEFDTRSGKITFTSGYRTFTITVVQSPKSAIILEKDSFEVGKDGGTITVVVKTTIDFEVVVPQKYREWIGVEPYTKGLDTRYVQLTVAANNGLAREGSVYVTSREKGLSAKATIYQEGVEPSITVAPETIEAEAEGGTYDITVTANVDYEVEITEGCEEWISYETVDAGTIRLTVAENEGEARSCVVKVFNDELGVYTTATINQEKYKVAFWTKTFTVGGYQIPNIYVLLNDNMGEDIKGCLQATKINVVVNASSAEMEAAKAGVRLDDNGKLFAYYNDTDGEIRIVTGASKISMPKNCYALFSKAYPAEASFLETITGLENMDFSQAENMESLFANHPKLKNLDVSSLNTENVQNMNKMFYGCSSLESVDLSRFNTANVQKMSGMFYGCSSLASVDLSSFNTENVQDMNNLFEYCSSLASLNLSRFNTTSVQEMDYMFHGCSSLKSLEVSEYFDIPSNYSNGMFSGVAYYDGTQHDFDVICNGIGEDQKASFRDAWGDSQPNCYNLLFNGVREWNWKKYGTEQMGEETTEGWF